MSKKRKANSYHPAKKAVVEIKDAATSRNKKLDKNSKLKRMIVWTVIVVSLALVATMSIVVGLQV